MKSGFLVLDEKRMDWFIENEIFKCLHLLVYTKQEINWLDQSLWDMLHQDFQQQKKICVDHIAFRYRDNAIVTERKNRRNSGGHHL